jgi:[ribosomal protein S5]-alanine N-acetyltransferase
VEIDLGHSLIREWRRGDEEALARHANNPNVSRNMRDRFPHPYSRADAAWWIARAGAQSPQTDFAIVVEGEAAGGIGFILQEDVSRRSVEIGYWLGEAFWGRGIATDAVRAMTDHIFANFDVCRIYATVFESNPASSRVLDKAGFILEGRLRKAVTKSGETIDALMYAMLKEDT